MSDERIEKLLLIQVPPWKLEQVFESMNSALATLAKDPFHVMLCHREIQERGQIFNVVLLISQPPARLVWDHLEFLSAEIQFREHLSLSCGSESAGLWANSGGQRVWKAQRETSRKVCLSQAACGCPSAWFLVCGKTTDLCCPGEWVGAHSHTALLKPQMTASYWLCKSLLQILLWQRTA